MYRVERETHVEKEAWRAEIASRSSGLAFSSPTSRASASTFIGIAR